jgi:hypothetical protein
MRHLSITGKLTRLRNNRGEGSHACPLLIRQHSRHMLEGNLYGPAFFGADQRFARPPSPTY